MSLTKICAKPKDIVEHQAAENLRWHPLKSFSDLMHHPACTMNDTNQTHPVCCMANRCRLVWLTCLNAHGGSMCWSPCYIDKKLLPSVSCMRPFWHFLSQLGLQSPFQLLTTVLTQVQHVSSSGEEVVKWWTVAHALHFTRTSSRFCIKLNDLCSDKWVEWSKWQQLPSGRSTTTALPSNIVLCACACCIMCKSSSSASVLISGFVAAATVEFMFIYLSVVCTDDVLFCCYSGVF